MNKAEQFNDILDACLERFARGETPEQCLASYPEKASELEPLLRTAAAARQAINITPRAEAKAKGWQQVSQTLREQKPARASVLAMPRWAVAVAALVIVLVAGGATVGAASDSMPDSFIYPIKLATEKAQLALTFSKIGKTELIVKLADRRVSEITAMAESGKTDKMAAPARRLDELLVAVAGPASTKPVLMQPFGSSSAPAIKETAPVTPSLASPPVVTEPPKGAMGITADRGAALPPEQAELVALLSLYQAKDIEKLQAVLEKAPPEVRALLESIISRYPTTYQQAIDTWQSPLP